VGFHDLEEKEEQGREKPAFLENGILKLAKEELERYFEGRLRDFTVPCHIGGTQFQRQVYQALLSIPYGQVISYEELAIRIGNSKACRAVGQANHRDPIAIIVPCHRVIGKAGKLVGYGGGLDKKAWLLNLEKKYGMEGRL
jgi:methylated-DNA-[protein]-cysteine S-methyltransferase